MPWAFQLGLPKIPALLSSELFYFSLIRHKAARCEVDAVLPSFLAVVTVDVTGSKYASPMFSGKGGNAADLSLQGDLF